MPGPLAEELEVEGDLLGDAADREVRDEVEVPVVRFVTLRRREGQLGVGATDSRKSEDRRCSSRWAWFVTMLAALTVAATEEASGVAPITIVPSNSVNEPRTFEATRCRTTKPTVEWIGSTV